MKSKLMLGLFIILWQLISPNLAHASFTASIDNHQVFLGQTFTLILESDDLTSFVEPDISPLKQNFELVSSQQNHPYKTGSGPVNQWQFKLRPLRTGSLVIPPISYGNQQSNQLNIQVIDFDSPSNLLVEPVYIDSLVDREQVYLQAQLLLTRRIYHSIPLYASGQLSPLSIEHARVEQLGRARQFEQFINGVRHGVIEVRYAIFPQSSGELLIPEQSFSATLAGHDPASLEPPSQLPGQKIQVSSAAIPIQVLDKPTDYPANSPWLPAKQLTLTQEWTPADEQISAGQALSRTLRISAEGLPVGSLPNLLPRQLDELDVYANPVNNQQIVSELGLTALHDEQQALLAEHGGLYEVPAVSLYWWNTDSDQLEQAVIEPYVFGILESKQSFRLSHLMALHKELWIWQMISLLLALSSLSFLLLWLKARGMPAITSNNQSYSYTRLQDSLKRACLANNPVQARAALDALARHSSFMPNEAATLSLLFQQALNQLNAALYTETEQTWNGKSLWQAYSSLQQEHNENKANHEQELPPLYPQ